MSAPPSASNATLLRVYLGLLALLALTAVMARVAAGPWSLAVGLAIATAKLLLIFAFFMGLRTQRGIVRIFAAGGFFWLGVAGLLTFSDYFTRGWRF